METVIDKYQKQLLEQAQFIFYENPISEATQKAYLETPRHLFVKRFREWGTQDWHKINDDNLEEHLATLYADRALILFGEDDENIQSTISQPSFVLRMLDMLQIEPGHKVLELGAGSGWNAAMAGYLVGPEGYVCSLEIIPEVAQMAADTIEQLDIQNVHIIEADGGEGYKVRSPYDRAIFTASAYDLPHHFFKQMRDDSLLLIILKTEGGADNLFLLRKRAEHFESIDAMQCGFVQMKGKYQIDDLEPANLDDLPGWDELKDKEISQRSFWWGGKGQAGFQWRTLGIRSFLSATEPYFRAFKTKRTCERTREEHYFGLWDKENHSLVITKDDCLYSYGNSIAEKRFMKDIKKWVELGMPSLVSFQLKIYPVDYPLIAGENQWIVKRNESQFLWSLNSA